jgi:hypothetical protein
MPLTSTKFLDSHKPSERPDLMQLVELTEPELQDLYAGRRTATEHDGPVYYARRRDGRTVLFWPPLQGGHELLRRCAATAR